MHTIRPSSVRARLALTLICALLLGGTEPAFAWTAAARRRMVEDASRLVPPALQRLLKRHRKEVAKGLTPRGTEAAEGHFQHADGNGQLVEKTVVAIRAAFDALNAEEPMRRVAGRLGLVAHLVADLNNPLASEASDPREKLYAEDFARYVEGILPKVRVTLEGRVPEGTDAESLHLWGMEAVARARRLYAPIGRSYWVEGKLVESRTFDERSIPFGIGALSYARAVNDIALAWMMIWGQGGGDSANSLYQKLMTSQAPSGKEKPKDSRR